jgi:hypothetical protein
MVKTLAEIEIDRWKIRKAFSIIESKNEWSEDQKLQFICVENKIDDWINQYHNKIFRDN